MNNHSDKRPLSLLRDAGVDMACEGGRFPPLHVYARNNNLYGLKFLLDNGVPVDILNKDKRTALEVAGQTGQQEAAELLKSYMCN